MFLDPTLPGVYELKIRRPYEPPSSSSNGLKDFTETYTTSSQCMVALLSDGTFRELGPDDDSIIGTGEWDFQGETGELVLSKREKSPSRSLSGSPDVLFMGVVSREGAEGASSVSVPIGRIATGRMIYPESHGASMEAPYMFDPHFEQTSYCKLRRVLADDAAGEEDALVERFTKARLEARRFYLRSEPLRGKRAPEDIFQARRRRKEEQKSKREKLQDADSAGLVTSLSVTEVVLHSNSTFDMVGGLGENRIRGRWQIMGDDRDQLYMSVTRWGFGRGVSGSVFSEGAGLTQDDDKSYWGPISEIVVGRDGEVVEAAEGEQEEWGLLDGEQRLLDGEQRLLEVSGAIMLGVGLEPTSVGRFQMREQRADEEE
ncbi:hypothetical protein TeGR_g14010 [Tetraparma gracilis]|uniref:Uncharacterized protein n=1 Tax=Tetraparma gracilis TaxID=2962635 RepID=A0ABQ6MW34_9STRA|nr:hypothetical protein TeGR_g14010 [Tetraparma gracilis]